MKGPSRANESLRSWLLSHRRLVAPWTAAGMERRPPTAPDGSPVLVLCGLYAEDVEEAARGGVELVAFLGSNGKVLAFERGASEHCHLQCVWDSVAQALGLIPLRSAACFHFTTEQPGPQCDIIRKLVSVLLFGSQRAGRPVRDLLRRLRWQLRG